MEDEKKHRLSIHIFCGRAVQQTRMSNFCRRPSWPRNPRFPRWYLQGGKWRGKKPSEPQCSCELQEFWSRCFFFKNQFSKGSKNSFCFLSFFFPHVIHESWCQDIHLVRVGFLAKPGPPQGPGPVFLISAFIDLQYADFLGWRGRTIWFTISSNIWFRLPKLFVICFFVPGHHWSPFSQKSSSRSVSQCASRNFSSNDLYPCGFRRLWWHWPAFCTATERRPLWLLTLRTTPGVNRKTFGVKNKGWERWRWFRIDSQKYVGKGFGCIWIVVLLNFGRCFILFELSCVTLGFFFRARSVSWRMVVCQSLPRRSFPCWTRFVQRSLVRLQPSAKEKVTGESPRFNTSRAEWLVSIQGILGQLHSR